MRVSVAKIVCMSVGISVAAIPTCTSADEGFYLYTDVPVAKIERDIGHRPSRAVLDKLQEASGQIAEFGSGAFISADGLWLTNFHVATAFLGDPAYDEEIRANGFYAASRDRELKLTANGKPISLRVLIRIEDVTSSLAPLETAQREVKIANLKRRDGGKIVRDVITLNGDSRFLLYTYKMYDDVRLVFLPETQVAQVSDANNESNGKYQSLDLDIAVLRVYENGRPVRPMAWLRVVDRAPVEGEAVFGSGSPGSSQRHITSAEAAFECTVRLPLQLRMYEKLQIRLDDAGRFKSYYREPVKPHFSRARYARIGVESELNELKDSSRLERSRAFEASVLGAPGGAATIAKLDASYIELAQDYARTFLVEQRPGYGASVLTAALDRVRKLKTARPSGTVVSIIYRGSETIGPREAGITRELERIKLASWLEALVDAVGAHDPWAATALQRKTPRERAREMASSGWATEILSGRADSLQPSSGDALYDMALLVAQEQDRLRLKNEPLLAVIGEAKREALRLYYSRGDGLPKYPDANLSLRFTYGRVTRYPRAGLTVPDRSTVGDLYRFFPEADLASSMPERWLTHRAELDSSTVLNFAASVDAVGGSSGSPIVDRNGSLIGVLRGTSGGSSPRYRTYREGYDSSNVVSSQVILAALRHIYGARALADEMLGDGPQR